MRNYRTNRKGFTLVEILIVVIILGILAAIVIPQFTNASTDAKRNSVTSQLQSLRSQIELYKLQHNDTPPDLVANWNQFTQYSDLAGGVAAAKDATHVYGPYMQAAPVNPLNGLSKAAAAAGAGVGWIYVNGQVTATNQDPTKTYDETTGTIQ